MPGLSNSNKRRDGLSRGKDPLPAAWDTVLLAWVEHAASCRLAYLPASGLHFEEKRPRSYPCRTGCIRVLLTSRLNFSEYSRTYMRIGYDTGLAYMDYPSEAGPLSSRRPDPAKHGTGILFFLGRIKSNMTSALEPKTAMSKKSVGYDTYAGIPAPAELCDAPSDLMSEYIPFLARPAAFREISCWKARGTDRSTLIT